MKLFKAYFFLQIILFLSVSSQAKKIVGKELDIDKEITQELQEIQKPQIDWFEPKVKVGSNIFSSKIVLYGRTTPFTRIGIDFKNIIIIKREHDKSKEPAKEIRSLTTANSNGLFYLTVELPNGINQVPIIIKSNVGKIKPIILTMKIQNKSVSMNTKVTKWVSKPKPKKVEKPKFKYSAKLSLGNYSLLQKYKLIDTDAIELKTNGFPMYSFDFSGEISNWIFSAEFNSASFKMPTNLGSYSVNENSAISSYGFAAKYKILSNSLKVYLTSDVFGNQQPLIVKSSLDKLYIYNFLFYSFSFGSMLSWEIWNILFEFSAKYEMPFLLNSSKGELSLSIDHMLRANLGIYYKYSPSFIFGIDTQIYSQKYDYEIVFVPQSIDTKGTTEILDNMVQFSMKYNF